MRLSSLSPEFLPATLVDALRTLGIVSDADLFFSATTLEVWRKLPPDLVALSEFERLVRAVMLQCAVSGFVATELVSDQLKPDVTTDVGNLDNLLGTTLRESVVEISGRHGGEAAVRSSPSYTLNFPTQTFVSWGRGEFQDARPAGHMQPFVLLPERDHVVDRRDWRLFSHESGHRSPIDGTARGPSAGRGRLSIE